MKFGALVILSTILHVLLLAPLPSSAQELFGVNVVVVPQDNSPVTIRKINIGDGDGQGSPEIVLENRTDREIGGVEFSTWFAQPQNCYDESYTPREPSHHWVTFAKPLLPHSTTTIRYDQAPSFLNADLPLRDLLSHAPTHTVGYAHVQLAIENVSFIWDGRQKRRLSWNRKHPYRAGWPWPFNNLLFNPSAYKHDHPDCAQWQAVVPLLHRVVGTDILLKDPDELVNTGAGVLRRGEGGYFYTCAYVTKPEESAFVCPNLSAPQKRKPGR